MSAVIKRPSLQKVFFVGIKSMCAFDDDKLRKPLLEVAFLVLIVK
jgi:hypothetical protein